MKKAAIVICSRLQSSRIPNKCFKKIAGVTALEHIIERLKPFHGKMDIILAVPHQQFNVFLGFNKCKYVEVFPGDDVSPLHRIEEYLLQGTEPGEMPEYVVRVTHDDILIDPQTLEDLVETVNYERVGYGISPGIVEGAGVEVIHSANIIHAAQKNTKPIEHISYFVKGDKMPEPGILKLEPRESIKRNYRLTMDYPEDANVLEAVLRATGPFASCDEVCKYLDAHPALLQHNRLPELSIYTCAKDAEKYVSEMMDTVDVAHGNFEHIVIEDGSKDRTLNELIIAGNHRPMRRLYVNDGNLGLAASSNIALAKCRGKYIMRVDADDKIMPFAVSEMIRKMEETGAAIVYANFNEVDENGWTTRYNVDAKENHHAGCALMNARFINEVLFTESLRHWDSLDLYNRVKAHFPIAYIEKPLWYYRRHKGSMSKNNLLERERAKGEIHNE